MKPLRYIILTAIFLISNSYGWDKLESYGENVVTVFYKEITLEKAEEVILKIEKIKSASKDPILLLLTTTGGHGGLIISNYIQVISNRVDVLVVGPCNSGGTILLSSATGKRYMVNDVVLGIHIPDQNNDSKMIKLYTKMYYDFYEKHCNLSESNIIELKKTGYAYFNAKSALSNGIVDEIINANKKAKAPIKAKVTK